MPLQNSLKDKILAKILPTDRIILGISGGPDSVFLFHILQKTLTPGQIIACHINYGLRGKDSDADQKFVENLCKKNKIRLITAKAPNNIKKGNLENNCREFRYKFFENIRNENKAGYICVAHHLNDQIETFFLNIARGSSLKGFQGMREYDEDRKLWRPLLEWPKESILKWLKTNNYKYRIDKTNFSNEFTRNKIRNEIIPLFIKINPNFINTTKKSLEDLRKNLKIIEIQSIVWLQKNVKNDSFILENFLQEPKIIQKNIIRELFKKVNQKSLTTHTIEEILDTLQKNRTGLKKEFGKSATLNIKKDPEKNKRIVVIVHKLK